MLKLSQKEERNNYDHEDQLRKLAEKEERTREELERELAKMRAESLAKEGAGSWTEKEKVREEKEKEEKKEEKADISEFDAPKARLEALEQEFQLAKEVKMVKTAVTK